MGKKETSNEGLFKNSGRHKPEKVRRSDGVMTTVWKSKEQNLFNKKNDGPFRDAIHSLNQNGSVDLAEISGQKSSTKTSDRWTKNLLPIDEIKNASAAAQKVLLGGAKNWVEEINKNGGDIAAYLDDIAGGGESMKKYVEEMMKGRGDWADKTIKKNSNTAIRSNEVEREARSTYMKGSGDWADKDGKETL